ncbi:MAG TPA: hypothetical protein VL096_07880, partial [Pirellulaceae bacterium]|nr:hypothetical protein [Pirellulaceae bacterium]
MHRAQLVHLTSMEALRQHAPAWNDLWQRSCVTIPTLQAELIEHWFRTFGQGTSFRAIAIEQGGRFIAALP